MTDKANALKAAATNPGLPETLRLDVSTVTNREWLWLEDTCGINVATLADHPIRGALAFRAIAVRRWQVEQGKPAAATWSEAADGVYDSIDFQVMTPETDDTVPTGPTKVG